MNLNYLLGLVYFIIWIFALVDCIKGDSPNKAFWVVVLLLVPVLGTILYFLLGRNSVRV